jgi:hypothetical protein
MAMTAGYGGGVPDPRFPGAEPPGYRPGLDAGRLWAGGVATAVVAALVAIVGLLIARGICHVVVLEPRGGGIWGNASTATYALVAAVAALLATGLMQLLSLGVPAPSTFFTWIMLLITAIAVVVPLTLTVAVSAKAATAAINLVIGLAITLIVNTMAASARTVHRRKRTAATQPPQQYGPPRQYGQSQDYERTQQIDRPPTRYDG